MYTYRMKPTKKSEVAFTEARQNLTAILDDVQKSGKPVTILRHGKPAAVIIPHEMYKQEIAKEKPFRLAGSFKVAPGVDIDEVLAKAKQERIELWEKRVKRLKEDLK
jgi:prevent-host-death family protein